MTIECFSVISSHFFLTHAVLIRVEKCRVEILVCVTYIRTLVNMQPYLYTKCICQRGRKTSLLVITEEVRGLTSFPSVWQIVGTKQNVTWAWLSLRNTELQLNLFVEYLEYCNVCKMLTYFFLPLFLYRSPICPTCCLENMTSPWPVWNK